jgi:hypothetical protein
MAIDPEILRQFEEMGPATVRVRLAKFQGGVYKQAIDWLAQKDLEERSRNDRESASDRATALSAKRAAWIAAIAAIIAAMAAIMDIMLELAKK